MADGLDFVVHSFDSPIRKPDLGPRQDAIEMAPQHLREFLEGLQLRPHRRVDPLAQVLLGAPRLLISPKQLEGQCLPHMKAHLCQFEWFLCLMSKSSVTTGGVANNGRPEVSQGFQGESSAGTMSSKIGCEERSNLTN